MLFRLRIKPREEAFAFELLRQSLIDKVFRAFSSESRLRSKLVDSQRDNDNQFSTCERIDAFCYLNVTTR
jgi:hypothetical protein